MNTTLTSYPSAFCVGSGIDSRAERLCQRPYSAPPAFSIARGIDRPHPAVKVLAPLLIMTAGTGGFMTAHTAVGLRRWTNYQLGSAIVVEPLAPKKIDVRSPAEHVANIRDGFAISMSDLAAILGITRPTAYAWLKGDEPKPEAIPRIQRLSSIADRVKGMNIERMDKLIHRKILNGESLFDLLKTDRDPSIPIQSLKEISEKEARTRQESKSSGKHRRSLDEISSESGVPIV
jgi:transcriptional regulator with XRE-family HTH domain